jgi:hypothetical protein
MSSSVESSTPFSARTATIRVPRENRRSRRRLRPRPSLPRLFLSYARSDDEPFVRRLYDDLTARGFTVWFDRESMPNRGLAFTREIEKAIAECDRLLLIVGPAALKSDYVAREWGFADQVGKAISPLIRIGTFTEVPSELRLLDARGFHQR